MKGKLAQASQSIADLQGILGDAGTTIDAKNEQIEALKKRVETFKLDKKNLLGIVQQLATIGNPAFNFQSFKDNFSHEDEEEEAETSKFTAQESQRSSQVVKGRNSGRRHERRINKPQARSFSDDTFINSIEAEVMKQIKDRDLIRSKITEPLGSFQTFKPLEVTGTLDIVEPLENLENSQDDYDYEYEAAVPVPAATKHFDVEKTAQEAVKDINDAVKDVKDRKDPSTQASSFPSFPNFMAIAQTLSTIIPKQVTLSTTKASTTTTQRTTTSTTISSTTTVTTTAPSVVTTEEQGVTTLNPRSSVKGPDEEDFQHPPILVGVHTVKINPSSDGGSEDDTSENKRSQSLSRGVKSSRRKQGTNEESPRKRFGN